MYGSYTCGTNSEGSSSTVWLDNHYKWNFPNSSNFLLDSNTLSSWVWTADFWMLKDTDTDKTLLFYDGPLVEDHDYGSDGLMYPAVFTELYTNNFQTSIYEICYMANIHNCRYSTGCLSSH